MRVSRRGFLGLAAAAGAGAAAGVATGASNGDATESGDLVPFHGERQAGIVTPAQDRLHMAAFDISPGVSRDELRDLLRDWTAAASPMTAGRLVGAVADPLAPPIDTGEAEGLPPARLTVTFGFGRTSRTTAAQATPRNLMGFKDGTNNVTAEDGARLAEHVWAGGEAPAWLRGGTYMVARRIRMLIEVWDRASLTDQEETIGRVKASGAPLGGRLEHDPVRPSALPPDSHVRLARPESNGGAALLRRGYSFTDGFDNELGQLDAGLFFIAFQRDPHRQFAAIQRRLGSADKLNEYIKHTGSALFAIPPGVRPGGSVGDGLFSA